MQEIGSVNILIALFANEIQNYVTQFRLIGKEFIVRIIYLPERFSGRDRGYLSSDPDFPVQQQYFLLVQQQKATMMSITNKSPATDPIIAAIKLVKKMYINQIN